MSEYTSHQSSKQNKPKNSIENLSSLFLGEATYDIPNRITTVTSIRYSMYYHMILLKSSWKSCTVYGYHEKRNDLGFVGSYLRHLSNSFIHSFMASLIPCFYDPRINAPPS